MRAEVDRQIEELLDNNVIRPSRSPYNSPIWVVSKKPKPNGEKQYRMVVDFKRLNAVTIPDTYPIPDINSTLASLGKAKYFTTLDLTSGFHQISMNPRDIPKTAFSTMNGKYEFLRLPFGLRNAPAIFQRMVDDVLRGCIGKICYVYIDDIIVYGGNIEEHLGNLRKVFQRLRDAHLRVNLEKTAFMKTEVEFLGYVVTKDGILPDRKKVRAILDIVPPRTLKELKSFLGLTSYYRRFIKDFAKVAKPLTTLTRGEMAQVKANRSKKVRIILGEEELQAFNELKELLTSSEVLAFPDFDKPFNLTTDASNSALGAVLSQGEMGKDKPITFISRSLNRTEEAYATNEKEMLAIVWALDNLRSYLYGAKKIRIFTDHQPLTFAMSNRNYNAKLKRWKARIEEYNFELIYKPGKSNVVADALSRLKTDSADSVKAEQTSRTASTDLCVHIADESSTDTASEGRVGSEDSDTVTASEGTIGNGDTATITASEGTVHSAEQDGTDLIPHVEAPINVFRNQIIIRQFQSDMIAHINPHPGYNRHIISLEEINKENLIRALKEKLRPDVLNGIKIPEQYLWLLQEVYLEHFSHYRLRITQRLVEDITCPERVFALIEEEHKRAHRNKDENKLQLLEKYYFPKMNSLVGRYTKNCEICKANKYDRHPPLPKLQATPIPSYPCEILHMDVFVLQNEYFISVLDKFSKFGKLFPLRNRSALQMREKIIETLNYFSTPRILVTDNERGFISPIVMNVIQQFGVKVYLTPVGRSEVNGQVERFHSTLLEIYRCLRVEYKDLGVRDLIMLATDRYNNTVHSVTNRKPVDIFFNRAERINYQRLRNFRRKLNREIRKSIKEKQEATMERHNAKRRATSKEYKAGDVVHVRNRQIKAKHRPLYEKAVVNKNNRVTVQTSTGKKIHKTHIKT